MSPEVWTSCRAIIAAVADDLGLRVEWPNEDFDTPEPQGMWLAVDISSEAAETIELGNTMWLEDGSIWCHVMIPLGIGIDTALSYRKAISNAFRSAQSSTVGLYFGRHAYDPPAGDGGPWSRVSLSVAYRFYDINTSTENARASLSGVTGMGATAA